MKEQLLATLEKSRDYTMNVASAMPGELYDFKPAESIWGFGELLQHIVYGIYWWEDNFIKGKKTDWNPPMAKTDRQSALAALEKAYGTLAKTVKGLSMDGDAVAGFHATLDHVTHHRGQATVYLRCKGITPPDYAY